MARRWVVAIDDYAYLESFVAGAAALFGMELPGRGGHARRTQCPFSMKCCRPMKGIGRIPVTKPHLLHFDGRPGSSALFQLSSGIHLSTTAAAHALRRLSFCNRKHPCTPSVLRALNSAFLCSPIRTVSSTLPMTLTLWMRLVSMVSQLTVAYLFRGAERIPLREITVQPAGHYCCDFNFVFESVDQFPLLIEVSESGMRFTMPILWPGTALKGSV